MRKNVKNVVGILTFMCRTNSILDLSEPEKTKFLIFLYLQVFKISCSAELTIKKV